MYDFNDDVDNEGGGAGVDFGNEVPDGPEGYELEDVDFPEGINASVEKSLFCQKAHRAGMTQKQAEAFWIDRAEELNAVHQQAYEKAKASQFAKIEESLQKGDGLHIGKEEAQILFDHMSSDMSHPYMDPKATPYAHERAVALANRLLEIISGKEVTLEGYVTKHLKEQNEQIRSLNDNIDWSSKNRSSSNEVNTNQTLGDNGDAPVPGNLR